FLLITHENRWAIYTGPLRVEGHPLRQAAASLPAVPSEHGSSDKSCLLVRIRSPRANYCQVRPLEYSGGGALSRRSVEPQAVRPAEVAIALADDELLRWRERTEFAEFHAVLKNPGALLFHQLVQSRRRCCRW